MEDVVVAVLVVVGVVIGVVGGCVAVVVIGVVSFENRKSGVDSVDTRYGVNSLETRDGVDSAETKLSVERVDSGSVIVVVGCSLGVTDVEGCAVHKVLLMVLVL